MNLDLVMELPLAPSHQGKKEITCLLDNCGTPVTHIGAIFFNRIYYRMYFSANCLVYGKLIKDNSLIYPIPKQPISKIAEPLITPWDNGWRDE